MSNVPDDHEHGEEGFCTHFNTSMLHHNGLPVEWCNDCNETRIREFGPPVEPLGPLQSRWGPWAVHQFATAG